MPSEQEVAEKIVKPYLIKKLRWRRDLVSDYGRVPVQLGRRIVWADLTFNITRDGKRRPYLLVEVKKTGQSMDEAALQAESYSLVLHSPFYCATDGEKYEYYITGDSQADSIRLSGPPPTPENEYLKNEILFPPRVDDLIKLFIHALREDSVFCEDMRSHVRAASELRKKIFEKDIESLSLTYLKSVLGNAKT